MCSGAGEGRKVGVSKPGQRRLDSQSCRAWLAQLNVSLWFSDRAWVAGWPQVILSPILLQPWQLHCNPSVYWASA